MNIRKVALWGGGFLALVVLARLIGGNQEPRPASSRPAPEAPAAAEPRQERAAPAPRPVEQAAAVSIKDLLGTYADNELRADNLYKGKLVQVTGVVGDVKKDITNTIYVTLGTGQPFEIPVVQCFFDDEHAGGLASLSKGAKVAVRGRVDGLMMNVLVKDCELVSLAP